MSDTDKEVLRRTLTETIRQLRKVAGADYTIQFLKSEADFMSANLTSEEWHERERNETRRRNAIIDEAMGIRRKK